MTETEKLLPGESLSVSLKGNVGKNHGLDETQESTMNKDLKAAVRRLEPKLVKKKARALQSKQA